MFGMHADNGVDAKGSTILWLVLEHSGTNRGMNACVFIFVFEIVLALLEPCYLTCDLWSSSFGLVWELIRNVEDETLLQIS